MKGDKAWVDPRPQDLTLNKIKKFYDSIKIGDILTFPSMGECFEPLQVDRRNTYIVAKGTVVAKYPHYILVELRRGVKECVSYFDIMKVNGKIHSGYVRGTGIDEAGRYVRRTVSE